MDTQLSFSEIEKTQFKNILKHLEEVVTLNSKKKGNFPVSEEQALKDLLDEVIELTEAETLEEKAYEASDVFLTLLVYIRMLKLDFPTYILRKHNFNTQRPYGHKRIKN